MGVLDKVSHRFGSLLPSKRRSHEKQQFELPPVGAEVLALRDNLDQWLQRFFEEPWGLPAASQFEAIPSTQVQETDNEVIVNAQVPGLDRTDLDLTVNRNGLTIRGERREAREDARGPVQTYERQYGHFTETIPLPGDVDVERAEARIERGVLTVRFPRLQQRAERRKIRVST